MRLRVLIADDERPARSFLAALLRTFPEVDLVAEAGSGAEAVELICRHRPDLALLDLQMPELDGLAVAALIERDYRPLIAFVTAYDEYAVKAFELNAIDYLLKPVERERLAATLLRAESRLERESERDPRDREVDRLAAAVDQIDGSRRPAYLTRLPIRRHEEIVLLPVAQLSAIESEGDLLVLTTVDRRRHYLTCRLKELELRLDPASFLRLNRGTIARIDQIMSLSPLPGGTYQVKMNNGQELQVSRQQARLLREQLLKI
ncbi:MAG: LytR/AlgR family response regulator transcription factor [Blastocatellia bacterium]